MADRNLDLTVTVLRERPRLMNFIRRRVRDQMDAEDILQDVLYSFVEAFRLPTSIEHATAWLYQVTRNRIIDRFRKRELPIKSVISAEMLAIAMVSGVVGAELSVIFSGAINLF